MRFSTSLLQRRWPWLVLLVLLAVGYYGSYVRYGINFRDEGGTVALLAKRLLAGERPFLDVELGYNVLWFYPIVGLFKLFHVNFVLLRGYCFALSTVTAVLAFVTVERACRRPWVAFLVALLAVLVPGMTFKNYMPLLAVGNSCCLLHFALGPRRRPGDPAAVSDTEFRWVIIGSVALGLTFLIRIDVGYFVLLLWLGAFWLRALRRGLAVPTRVSLALGGPAVLVVIVALVHLPVWLDARHRGFDQQLVARYTAQPHDIADAFRERLTGKKPALAPAPVKALPAPEANRAAPTPAPAATPAHPEEATSWNSDGLRRRSLLHLRDAKDNDERLLTLCIWLPLLILLPLVAWAGFAVLRGLRDSEPGAFEVPLAALLLLGGALTTFPQYFFFRPDAPHISEFSPGYWVAAFGATLLLGFSARASRAAALAASAILVLLCVHTFLFLDRMLPDRWTGTIAVRKNRTQLFHGENGVDVFVSKREYTELNRLLAFVREHSAESDYLIAWPYHPSVNLLCNRRTYERNVYVDNATREPGWNAHAITRIQKFHPAIIVISDWAINGTEASRFSVWAERTKTWIQTNYLSQGVFLDFEVFSRPEKEF